MYIYIYIYIYIYQGWLITQDAQLHVSVALHEYCTGSK